MSKKLRLLSRIFSIILGLLFVVFGLNGFLHFIPLPAMEGSAAAFMAALAATGYMFPLIKGSEGIGGALLLSGRGVPLGLLILAPIIVNILAFHLILTPGESSMSLVITAIAITLAWIHRSAWRGLLGGAAA